MKQPQRLYLTHPKMPALVHGISYLLTLTVAMVSLCLLPVTSFADIQDNTIVKKDATLTIEPGVANALSDNTALSQSFLMLRNFLSSETAQETSSRQIRAGNISTNPADVEPFRGTTWEFTYTVGSNTYTSTISFLESVNTLTDGSVVLFGKKQNGSVAIIGKTSFSGEYLITITGPIIKEAYVVTLDGCCKVQGEYYITSLDPNFKDPDPLTGIRTSGGPQSTSVVLTVTTSGNGKVTSSAPGIDCGSTCSASYPSQTSVILIASPAAGATFAGWTGACSGALACQVEMTEAKTVNARFDIMQPTVFPLTVNLTGAGTGKVMCNKVDCLATYPAKTTVALTATPATGATFAGWTGACSGTLACQAEMTEAKTVNARFDIMQPTVFPLTVNLTGAGTGKVMCNKVDCLATQNYPANTAVTLTATPASGATFAGWTGACSGAALACQVEMTEAKTVNARFGIMQPTEFPLTVNLTGAGTGKVMCNKVDCLANYPANTTVALTATPATGATFVGWTGACSGAALACQVEMTEAKTVNATFHTGGQSQLIDLEAVEGKAFAWDINGQPVKSGAILKGGISFNGGPYQKLVKFGENLMGTLGHGGQAQSVTITGSITPDPKHACDKCADIFAFGEYFPYEEGKLAENTCPPSSKEKAAFYAMAKSYKNDRDNTQPRNYQLWDGKPATLPILYQGVTLKAGEATSYTLYEGPFDARGCLNIGFGYRVKADNDDEIVYNHHAATIDNTMGVTIRKK